MSPHCSMKLKVQKKNTIKDFKHAAGVFGVTHFQVFTATESGTYLRLMRFPHGPTLHFRVVSFTLMRELISAARASVRGIAGSPTFYQNPPLIVLNNLSGTEPHVQMIATSLQSVVPPLVVEELKLATCQRILLFHHHADKELIDVRHYAIVPKKAVASKVVRRLTVSHTLPRKLAALTDVAELIEREDAVSDHDSDAEAITVTTPQPLSQSIQADTQTSIKLVELGPRMTVQLVKITAGFASEGEILYHRLVTKTPQEVAELEQRRKKREREKKLRREQQEARVAAKKEEQSVEGDAKVEDYGRNDRDDLEVDGGYDGSQPSKIRRLIPAPSGDSDDDDDNGMDADDDES